MNTEVILIAAALILPISAIILIAVTSIHREKAKFFMDFYIEAASDRLLHSNTVHVYRASMRWPYRFDSFDKIILPMYGMTRRIAWRMVFHMKWKHLLTGRQRFLAGIRDEEYVPTLTVAMWKRKPWKVWSHEHMYHNIRVLNIWSPPRYPTSMAMYRGIDGRAASGLFTSPTTVVPAGMIRPRKTS